MLYSHLLSFAIGLFSSTGVDCLHKQEHRGFVSSISVIRVRLVATFIQSDMRRKDIINLLGRPEMQVVASGYRGEVYLEAGVTINYDPHTEKVIGVYWIKVTRPRKENPAGQRETKETQGKNKGVKRTEKVENGKSVTSRFLND